MAVAFGLWGQDAKYLAGALANAHLVPQVYPGWEMHVWHDGSVPGECVEALAVMGCRLHAKDAEIPNMFFQRMLVHDLPGVARYLVRDCDSRVTARERKCVDEWIASGALLHTIHDHPYHKSGLSIMGGLFGVFREADQPGFEMRALLRASPLAHETKWNSDQIFLDQQVWPRYRHSVMQHGKKLPIPADPEDPEAFCGEVLDAAGVPNAAHRAVRRAAK